MNSVRKQFTLPGRASIVTAMLVSAGALALGAVASREPAASRSFARVPLRFEPADQTAPAGVQFLARGPGHAYFLSPTEATLVLQSGTDKSGSAQPQPKGALPEPTANLTTRTVRFQLVGGNPAAPLRGVERGGGTVNYLLGNNPEHWRTGVATFGKVQVAEAYPGVDVIYYPSDQQLEYDFQIAPGGKPEAIRIHVAGADSMRVDTDGSLLLRVGGETIRQHAPVAYQMDGAVQRRVTVAYRLEGDQTFSFTLGAFDRRLPLVIDPVLSYATYLGGAAQDTGWDVALDNGGNVYVTGGTLSPALGQSGGFQTNFAGGTVVGDVFVAKLDPSGSNLIYLTYLGGTADDTAYAIAVDAAGSAYITGATYSTNFPTANALQPNLRGTPPGFFIPLYPAEAFVTKLNPAGSALVYSTFLGGDQADLGIDIAVDAGGNAYVTGYTQSTNFPTTNAFQSVLAGGDDAFVAKIVSNGTALAYATYLGGTNTDQGQGIVVNVIGEAFVAGYTQSTNFPTKNAFQSWLAGGKDAFLTQLGAAGTNLVRSTYLGGELNDMAFRIAMDSAGNAYVAGSKSGFLFPVTPSDLNPGGLYQSSDAGLTWHPSDKGLASPQVNSLAFDPVSPTRIYAGTGRGIARSSDGGVTWDVVIQSPATAEGLAPYLAVGGVTSIAVDPVTPATIYAATYSEVYKSLDRGTNWSLMNTGLVAPIISALAINPQTPSTLYASTTYGVSKSTNGAAVWSSVFSLSGVTALAINPAAPATVYAGTPHAIYRTTDGGNNWITFTNGFTNEFRDTLVIDPVTPSTLYAGTWGGIFKTTDSGTNWVMLNLGSPYNTNITAIAINPQAPSTLYAAFASHLNRVGILKSVDGGNSWLALANNTENGVASLAVNPQTPTQVLAGQYGFSFFGLKDVFVAKFGANLEYSASFGGGGNDEAWSVAVDPVGNAYVTGITSSTNFPTELAFQTTNAGGDDVFVAALDASGGQLLFSTYLGGEGADSGYGIDVDAGGNAWIVGQTLSTTNLTTANALKPTFAGGAGDAFLARISPQPRLTVSGSAGNVVLAWRAYAPDFKLQSNSNVVAAAGWSYVGAPPVLANGWHTVTLPATNRAQFFRLVKP